jgi:hypothetical protein
MKKQGVVPIKSSSPGFQAVLNGQVIFSGSMTDVTTFIAQKRFEGYDARGRADGPTEELQRQGSLRLENCVEVHCFAFRLQEIDGPVGVYLPGVFRTALDAERHRADELGDPGGNKYAVKDVNWRGARL